MCERLLDRHHMLKRVFFDRYQNYDSSIDSVTTFATNTTKSSKRLPSLCFNRTKPFKFIYTDYVIEVNNRFIGLQADAVSLIHLVISPRSHCSIMNSYDINRIRTLASELVKDASANGIAQFVFDTVDAFGKELQHKLRWNDSIQSLFEDTDPFAFYTSRFSHLEFYVDKHWPKEIHAICPYLLLDPKHFGNKLRSYQLLDRYATDVRTRHGNAYAYRHRYDDRKRFEWIWGVFYIIL
jgi:hypothetical protein